MEYFPGGGLIPGNVFRSMFPMPKKSTALRFLLVAAVLVVAAGFISMAILGGDEGAERKTVVREERGTKPPGQGSAVESGGRDRSSAGTDGPGKAVPSFVGLDAGGRITTGSIRSLGLTDPEVDALTEVISSFQDSVAEDFVGRTKLLESRKSGDNFHYTYFTKARDDRGKGLLDGMRGQVKDLLGEEKGGQFAAGVGKSEISGSIGKYDIETLITRENGTTVVRQKYLNAKNGAVVRTLEESGGIFKERFGDLFEIPGG